MIDDPTAPRFVSTGTLPGPDAVAAAIADAHARYAGNRDGANATVYPALAAVDPDLLGIAVVGAEGGLQEIGDTGHCFAIMSVSKPFVFALVCDAIGPGPLRAMVGANATGHAFNSLAAIEASPDGRTNPMVNSGAIATTSLVPGGDDAARWRFIHDGLSRFAGHDLPMDSETLASAEGTNQRNRAIAAMLDSLGRLHLDPAAAVALYTRQCCLDVNARDLAVMGATLAAGGINPLTGKRVVSAAACHYALAVMVTAGLYETSGDWLYDIGVPGKSGIGGGIVAVAPGKGGLGTFGPRLDAAGNSVKGQLVARHLSQTLGLDLFVARPEAGA